MISIKRFTKPSVLKNVGSDRMVYNHKKVVEVLFQMQHGKCCYCERTIPRQGLGKHVEHFRPKAIFTDLINDWSNLLLACPQCNGFKKDKFPMKIQDDAGKEIVQYVSTPTEGAPMLVDPSDKDVDPEDHLEFDVFDNKKMGEVAQKSDKGGYTIEVIGLNRKDYLRDRKSVLLQLMKLRYKLIESDEREKYLAGSFLSSNDDKEEIEKMMEAHQRFSALVKTFVRFYRLDIDYDVVIP